MNKAYLIGFLLNLVLMQVAFGQSDWIDFSKTYYKIPTSQDGIHRINFAALASAGINPSIINPNHIRMYFRGEEVAIHVEGAQDGSFDANDYIDFFGRRNDGTLDAKLYKDPSHVGNIAYNTHNDTTAFYLAVTPGVNGRRMAQRAAPAPTAPTLQTYQDEYFEVFAAQYNLGRVYNPGVRIAEFEEGQGWMSPPITRTVPLNLNLTDLGPIPENGRAVLEIGLTGRSDTPHVSVISVGPTLGNLRQVGRFEYADFQAIHRSIEINAGDFDRNGVLRVQIASQGPQGVDNVSIAYLRLTYPKTVVGGERDKQFVITEPGVSAIEFPQILGNYQAYDVTDPLNPERVAIVKEGQLMRFQAQSSNSSSKILLQNNLEIIPVGSMVPTRFRDFLSRSADFILLTHRSLRRPTRTYADPVVAYAAHRASPAGGSYDTLIVNIDELYDQFTFGEKTPLAIYKFLQEYYPIHKPEHLLLVGRSVGIFATAREGNTNFFYRQRPSIFNFQDMIPPAGYPYADNNFSMGLNPEDPYVGEVAIGRLPVRNSQQVADYLDKIKEKDALGHQAEWLKEIVHLSGGISAFELQRFFNFLNGFKDIAQGKFLGGNVTTYRKRSNSTIELIDISGDVNKGVNLITFFGHGAPTVIDIEIGFASDPTIGYKNQGKYPILLLNGCDAGNAFGNAYTFGEDWIVTPQKGASNFLAHASLGVDVFLRRYSEAFYTKAFADSTMIHRPIGVVKRETERLFYRQFGTSAVNRSHGEQLVMLGDPAVRMFPANKADYAVQESEVFLGAFEGDVFNALSDSLELKFVLRNLGIVNTDSVNFKVSRRLPDGTDISYPLKKVAGVFRKDTISFAVPNTGLAAFGENNFTIEINTDRVIPEMTFMNNSVTVTRFIPLSGTIHLLPSAFGIVNEREVELIAQIPGKSIEQRTVVVQIDTSPNFNSSSRRENRITTSNILQWKLDLFQNIQARDSVTFYWRSRFLQPQEGESEDWTSSSFSFIRNGPEGWTQREVAEIQTNILDNIAFDSNQRRWDYQTNTLDIGVFTFGNQADSLTFRNTQFYLDGVPYILDNINNANSRLCPDGSLGLVAFEQKSLTPYLVIPVPGFDILDGRSCGRVPQVIQSIRNAQISNPGQTFLIDYINGLREGDFVVIFSVGNVNYEQWPDAAFQSLRQVGANEAVLRNLKNGDPYILYGQKGMRTGEAVEIVAQRGIELETNEQIIEFETSVKGYITSGSIITPRIGPASDWKLFFNRVNKREWFNNDFAHFDVIGVRPSGEEQVLLTNVNESLADLTGINPSLYPFLRLRYSMDDPASTAPAQLNKWQVNYTGVPEGVLIFKNRDEQLTLQEGLETSLNFEFINISKYDFLDSIQVDWKITNNTQRTVQNFSRKFPALAAGERIEFAIPFNSIGRGGENEIEVFANPRILMEQTFRNNLIDLGNYITVIPDNTTAILDVSFDGVYIMDGDIVSPTVMITTLLKNETSLLLKRDTVGIELFLRKQCEGCQFGRINFSDPRVFWTEATENSGFRIEMRPGPLEDGIYTLRVVTDDLGVEKPYEINFEVINEATISNFYPYPNPFSTSVRFVFTVTGNEVPDQIKIQIMTVTGRVVREILQDELGAIRIGNNITEYAWDGRDEFGDQLANGVYIYRVLVRKNGAFVELRNTAGDKAFRQGYGKMYLLR
ncbi:putative type IX secretion system sortase PorU2 [Mongoliitalea daihaiensis]|uniref:putative type IX secretion system sortase PorU2 n=1 Tax=Mongoliitalea daihaiensis TaxID=2782006 RepID=UPI001F35CF3E|nr:C25 family cysteine peptidase [Mongoliitalea daihaiensis]UJP65011.1 transporter [Mongoliitalea daihaiensis]